MKDQKKKRKATPVTSPAGRRIELDDPTDHLEEIRRKDQEELEKLLEEDED